MDTNQFFGSLVSLTAGALMLLAAFNGPVRRQVVKFMLLPSKGAAMISAAGRLPKEVEAEAEVGADLMVRGLGLIFGLAFVMAGVGLLYAAFIR
ncbi:MAG TPA: hypothetical protein VEY09_11130 [Pyrinomonadaceae bacterium]|nr:hypothetical protein [Pyrinomonadaceae bacterium]